MPKHRTHSRRRLLRHGELGSTGEAVPVVCGIPCSARDAVARQNHGFARTEDRNHLQSFGLRAISLEIQHFSTNVQPV